MQATIVGLQQELSLMSGETANYIVLELAGGEQVRAEVDFEAVQIITTQFVQSGSSAAQIAAERANSEVLEPAASAPQPPVYPGLKRPVQAQPEERQYSSMSLADDGESLEFGGEGPSEGLQHMAERLVLAERNVASAIGDTSELTGPALRQAANALRQGDGMPAPAFATTPSNPTRRSLRVEQDSMGNPVIRGAGLVDPMTLSGGANAEEGDVGSV